MEISLVINPGLDFLFAKLTSISLTLEDIQPFDPKYALRSLRILNWALASWIQIERLTQPAKE